MRDEEIQHSGEDDLPINNDRRSGVSVAVRDKNNQGEYLG